ncbi:MAG: hypothetical protein PUD63_08270 [Clostridia bacterium]|nr:hypothetical protein [Clostridia bacterium]
MKTCGALRRLSRRMRLIGYGGKASIRKKHGFVNLCGFAEQHAGKIFSMFVFLLYKTIKKEYDIPVPQNDPYYDKNREEKPL